MAVTRQDIDFLSRSMQAMGDGFQTGDENRRRDREEKRRLELDKEMQANRDRQAALAEQMAADRRTAAERADQDRKTAAIEARAYREAQLKAAAEAQRIREEELQLRKDAVAERDKSPAQRLREEMEEYTNVARGLATDFSLAMDAGDEARALELQEQMKIFSEVAKARRDRLMSGEATEEEMVDVSVKGPNGSAKMKVPRKVFESDPSAWLGKDEPTLADQADAYTQFVSKVYTLSDGRQLNLTDYYQQTRDKNTGKPRANAKLDGVMEALLEEALAMDPGKQTEAGTSQKPQYTREQIEAELKRRGLK